MERVKKKIEGIQNRLNKTFFNIIIEGIQRVTLPILIVPPQSTDPGSIVPPMSSTDGGPSFTPSNQPTATSSGG